MILLASSSSSFAPASHFLTALPGDTFLACGYRDSPHISRVQKYMASHLFSMAPSGGTPAHARSPVSKLEGGFAWKFIARSLFLLRSWRRTPLPIPPCCLPPSLLPSNNQLKKFAWELAHRSKMSNTNCEGGRERATWLSKRIST